MIKCINTDKAPKAIGPYSQATLTSAESNLLFASGQIGVNPITNKMVEGGLVEETRQVFRNIRAVLKEGGSNLSNVLKVDIF